MQDYRAGYRNRNGGAASASDSEAPETWRVTLAGHRTSDGNRLAEAREHMVLYERERSYGNRPPAD